MAILSRRNFLKIGALSLGSLGSLAFTGDFPPGLEDQPLGLVGRVSYESVSLFDRPRLDATTVGYRFRDDLLNIYKRITSTEGPAYNPVWYRVWGGYVHSAFVQEVRMRFNEIVETPPAAGLVTELTVPWSRPYNFTSGDGWLPNEDFRLYYGSTHWVTDLVEGPDGAAWYQITDELWDGFTYYVPAPHLRPVADEELTPISPGVSDKRIEVSLASQQLSAFEGDQMVFRTQVSTGIPNQNSAGQLPTKTPVGNHNVVSKMPSKHMGAGRLTDTLGDRALPGVPYTMFFAEGGYALHGTYWHNNFGWPMSRGCVNLRNEDAKWLFRWVTPNWIPGQITSSRDWEARGLGTRVIVTED
jgi:lipoprotein-anchoring transpeptidase ErfK/SrfK